MNKYKSLATLELVTLLKDRQNWNKDVLSEVSSRIEENNFTDLCASELKDQGCIDLRAALDKINEAEDFKEELDYTDFGKLKHTYSNICKIVRNDFQENLSYNVMDGRAMITGVPWDLHTHPIRDNDIHHIREHINSTYGFGSEADVYSATLMAAQNNLVNPIRDVLDKIEWDGKPRIAELFPRYLGAERSDYTTAVTRILLSGAIKRIYNPGCKFDLCVVLADHKQGTGKSTMCRLLALKDEWFCDSLGDLSNTKTAFESIRGKWICEMPEMTAIRRTKDIEAIKAYISRMSDFYREPYSKCSEDYPRRCVFICTTNAPQFLPDDKTGNRRFLPILCDGDKAEVHPMENEFETRLFIIQCYAEIISTSNGDYMLTLPREYETELDTIREQSTPENSWVGIIQEWLDTTDRDIVCTQMIWEEALCGDFKRNPTRYEANEISDILTLKIKGWEKYTGKTGKAKTNVYRFRQYGVQRAWQRCNRNCNQDCNQDGFVPVEESENVFEPVFD